MTIKPSDAILAGLKFAAERSGHGEAWSSGLGTIAQQLVNASAVPQAPVTVQEIQGRLGLTPERIDLAQALFGLAKHAGLIPNKG